MFSFQIHSASQTVKNEKERTPDFYQFASCETDFSIPSLSLFVHLYIRQNLQGFQRDERFSILKYYFLLENFFFLCSDHLLPLFLKKKY